MKKRKENINQHYVPQSYYRNFSSNRTGLKIYDWKRDSIYTNSISTISQKPYFYDVDPQMLSVFLNVPEIDEQFVDVSIKKYIEDSVGVVLQDFTHLSEEMNELKEDDVVPFSEEAAVVLQNFIIIQLIRTPVFRQQFEMIAETMKEAFHEYETAGTPIHDIQIEEWTKIIHNVFLFGTVHKLTRQSDDLLNDWYKITHAKMSIMVDSLLASILNAGMIFFHSEIDIPFITSDNPVVVEWKTEIMADGFSTLFLPLNSKFALLLFDWEEYTNFRKYNGGIYVINDEKKDLLENLNLMTTHRNTERLYADISYEFIEERKYIKEERRMKVEF